MLCGQLAAPLPLPIVTGLPVHVIGRFELKATHRGVQLQSTSSHADDSRRVEWNRELFAAVAVAYHSLLSALPRQLHPSLNEEAAYRFWPTKESLALDELDSALLTPLYSSAADSPLFLATPRDIEEERMPKRSLRKLEDGFVLGSNLDPRVESFVRQHFTVFDLPPPLAEHLVSSQLLLASWRNVCGRMQLLLR